MSEVLNEIQSGGKNELAIIDESGDTKVIWDPDRDVEVKTARDTFDTLRAKGYSAFRVKRDGEAGEAITKFDPEAGKIIMIPQQRGG